MKILAPTLLLLLAIYTPEQVLAHKTLDPASASGNANKNAKQAESVKTEDLKID